MMKRMSKVGLAVVGLVMLMGSFYLAQAGEKFSCTIEPKGNILLESEGKSFLILKNHGGSFLQVENVNLCGYWGGKTPWLDKDTIEEAKVILDTAEKKIVYLSFQYEEKFQVQLNLEIKKDLPCIFVSSQMMNMRDEPGGASCTFYMRGASYYTKGKDLSREKIPSGGTTGGFKSVLLSWPEKSESVGIISLTDGQQLTGGGNNNFSWKQGLLEEGEIGFSQQFILSPAKTIEELNSLYEKIQKEGIKPSSFVMPAVII